MGYLFRKFNEARKASEERDKIGKVVRVLIKSMDFWISTYNDFGKPPTEDECGELEAKRITDLLASYPAKITAALGREITDQDDLVHEKERELQKVLISRKGRLYQRFSGTVQKLEQQAAEHLGNCLRELKEREARLRSCFPTKQSTIDFEFEDMVEDLKLDIEARYPGGVDGLDRYDDTLPDGLPSWEIFVNRMVVSKKAELGEENARSITEMIATMKESTANVIKDKINAAIRTIVDDIKLDLSDDVIDFLDDSESDALRKELMEITEHHGASRLVHE